MSANAAFWANIRYLYTENVHGMLYPSEKVQLAAAVDAASTSNVLVGIPAEVSRWVQELVATVQERIKSQQKQIDGGIYSTWMRV